MSESEKRAAPGRLPAADVEAIVLTWRLDGMEDRSEDCSVDLHEFADREDAEAFRSEDADTIYEVYHINAIYTHTKGGISA